MPDDSQGPHTLQVANSLLIARSRLFETNAGAFIRNGEAYLIDPAILPDEIDALARTVARADVHLRAIVITHSHWDHILGPERFAGVPVIAHASVARAFASELEIAQLVDERLAAHGAPRTMPFVPPSIDIMIESHLTLPFSEGTLTFFSAPGHCADQIVVYETAEKILWAADMLSDIEIPFIEDVSAYRSTLERIMKLDIAVLVPGHGNATADRDEIQARITSDYSYLQNLENDISMQIQLGHSLDQISERLGSQPVRNPATNTKEHLRNIQTVYAAITNSKIAAQ